MELIGCDIMPHEVKLCSRYLDAILEFPKHIRHALHVWTCQPGQLLDVDDCQSATFQEPLEAESTFYTNERQFQQLFDESKRHTIENIQQRVRIFEKG